MSDLTTLLIFFSLSSHLLQVSYAFLAPFHVWPILLYIHCSMCPLGHMHLIILMFAPCPIHPIQLFAPFSLHMSSLLYALCMCTSDPSMCAICPVYVIALMWATSPIHYVLNCSAFSPAFYSVPPNS